MRLARECLVRWCAQLASIALGYWDVWESDGEYRLGFKDLRGITVPFVRAFLQQFDGHANSQRVFRIDSLDSIISYVICLVHYSTLRVLSGQLCLTIVKESYTTPRHASATN